MRLSWFHLAAALGLGAFGAAEAKCACTNRALELCLRVKGVPFKVKCDKDWKEYSLTPNLGYPFKPAVITLPDTPEQVAASVVCAGQNGLKVQAKSGGNSYAAYSFGGIDGQMTVDLAKFNETVLSEDGTVAVVGGGVRLGPMAKSLYAQGKRAVSHGICPSVGIGGHATHGGWGYTSRAWGLTLDHILEMQVVLANGTIVLANPETNTDLYWAMRGAADSIGIATSFTLRTQPAPEEVINFTYDFPAVLEDVELAVDTFLKLQTFISSSPVVDRRLSLALQTFFNSHPEMQGMVHKTFRIDGTFLGGAAEFNTTIAPAMLAGLPDPEMAQVASNGWLDSLAPLSPDGTLDGTTGYLDFFANSVTIDTPGLSRAALTRYFAYMIDGPPSPTSYLASMELWGGADSQINLPEEKRRLDFAAFPHRNVFWTAHNLARVGPGYPFPPEGVEWVKGLRQAILEDIDVPTAAYPNLLDPTLSREEAHQLYYGAEVLERLQCIKNDYDPGDLYWNPQSI